MSSLPGLGSWYARADWAWVGEYYTNATLDPRHVQPAYSLVNLRTGLRFGNYDLFVWAQNAGDRTYVLQDGATNLFPQRSGICALFGRTAILRPDIERALVSGILKVKLGNSRHGVASTYVFGSYRLDPQERRLSSRNGDSSA